MCTAPLACVGKQNTSHFFLNPHYTDWHGHYVLKIITSFVHYDSNILCNLFFKKTRGMPYLITPWHVYDN